MIRNPWELQQEFLHRKVSLFATEILGVTLHPGQVKWVDNAWQVINVLDPSNQWGKTLAESVFHIYHACVKPQLVGKVTDYNIWNRIGYRTLNVGKTYEIAKGVMEMIQDIVEGNLLLPNGLTNRSMLKDWAITEFNDSSNKPPSVKWWNGSETLIRSYDDLGSSFKRLKLAFVSSDECGDIPELELFLNGTLLPRVAFWRGQIHLIGTHQPKGEEYAKISEMASEDIIRAKEDGRESDYYHQTGNLYENPYMDREYIKKLEGIADPKLREQIIYGKYVDSRDHFFSFYEIDNMFIDSPYDPSTGYTEVDDKGNPIVNPKSSYVVSVDLAATEDETAISVIEFNRFVFSTVLNRNIELPYRVVFHRGFKGETIPISMQYELIKTWFLIFKSVCKNSFFVFDAGSLGGKNAQDAFKELFGYGFPGVHKNYATEKAYAIGSLKEVVGRGRRMTQDSAGRMTDVKMMWGFLKIPKGMKELRRQFEMYALEDKDLKQDRIATIWQAIHFIEKRRPRMSHNRAESFDILSSTATRVVSL